MTIDEAIKHAREKVKEQRKDYEECIHRLIYGCNACADYYSKPCNECAEEHEQLAEWLEELKDRRQTNFDYVSLMDKRYSDGYNKAIFDLYEKLNIALDNGCILTRDTLQIIITKMMEEIDFKSCIEQLKEGGTDE